VKLRMAHCKNARGSMWDQLVHFVGSVGCGPGGL